MYAQAFGDILINRLNITLKGQPSLHDVNTFLEKLEIELVFLSPGFVMILDISKIGAICTELKDILTKIIIISLYYGMRSSIFISENDTQIITHKTLNLTRPFKPIIVNSISKATIEADKVEETMKKIALLQLISA